MYEPIKVVTAILLLIAAVIGIVTAYIGLTRNKGYAELAYYSVTEEIRRPHRRRFGHRIFYGLEERRYLFLSYLGLFNLGTSTIRSGDVDSTNPLRIELQNGGRLFSQPEIVQQSREECAFDIVTDHPGYPRYWAVFSFSEIKPGDGCIIRILYSGPRNSVVTTLGFVANGGMPRRLGEPHQSSLVTRTGFAHILSAVAAIGAAGAAFVTRETSQISSPIGLGALLFLVSYTVRLVTLALLAGILRMMRRKQIVATRCIREVTRVAGRQPLP